MKRSSVLKEIVENGSEGLEGFLGTVNTVGGLPVRVHLSQSKVPE